MSIKILLADDSVTAQNMGKKILGDAGHDVVTVNNGAAAARKIAEIKPDLVLLDVFMPGYTGLELCERLRRADDTAKMPVLLTVGRMEPYSPQDGARVKADGVIVKPFEASDLIAAVDRLAQKLISSKPGHKAELPRLEPQPVPKPESFSTPSSSADESAVLITPASESEPAPVPKNGAALVAGMLNRAMSSRSESAAAAPAEVLAPVPEMAAQHDEPAATIDAQIAEPASAASGPAIAPPESSEVAAFAEELISSSAAAAQETQPTTMNSLVSQYLAEHATFNVEPMVTSFGPPSETAVGELPAFLIEAEAAHSQLSDVSSAAAPIEEAPVQHFAPVLVEAPTATETAFESTAAPVIPEMEIAKEASLELTVQPAAEMSVVEPDPALMISDRHAPVVPSVQIVSPKGEDPESAAFFADLPPADEEFESRLKQALAAFEIPSVEPPASVPEDGVEQTDEPVAQAHPSSVIDISEAAAAIASTELAPSVEEEESITAESEPIIAPVVEIGSIGARHYLDELPSMSVSEPEPDAVTPAAFPEVSTGLHLVSSHELRVDEVPAEEPVAIIAEEEPADPVAEAFASAETAFTAETPAPEDAVASAFVDSPVGEEYSTAQGPEMDDVLIHQVREAFTYLPAESATAELDTPAPLAMAAAAAASAPAMASPLSREAELEFAKQIQAALAGGSVEAPIAATEAVPVAAPTVPSDANRLATAVEKVLQRELPNLVWKVMAEIDLQKRS